MIPTLYIIDVCVACVYQKFARIDTSASGLIIDKDLSSVAAMQCVITRKKENHETKVSDHYPNFMRMYFRLKSRLKARNVYVSF
ncbi:hypothetical protein [Methanosarcina barkeri]|uniref:Uncharacterized protein n=1 Tax=Methanosarcina barkeri CM1 TaxID=796385 RepID=A0A0G3CIH8_METBA|nr:hypothetical protein [Methanosarcina barkeri]AKJ39703.1 hypothetical protein MCM1_2702 [Methanosarcina barkeri CM1]